MSLLTARTQELVDVIGLDAALQLVKECGGTRIWVVKHAKEDNPYALLIGFDAWRKLTRHYADTYLEIDLCAGALREMRNQKILADSLTLNDNQLARKYRTTDRHIRRIRQYYKKRRLDTYDPQLDLFESLLNERA